MKMSIKEDMEEIDIQNIDNIEKQENLVIFIIFF